VHPAILRVLASAGVAGGLGLVFWLVIRVVARSHVARGFTCGGGGCLFLAIVGSLAGLVAVVVLAWPLLRAVGVRPAWPVALLGPVIAIAAYREFFVLVDRSLVTGLWILLAVSYAAAAVITAPRLYRYGSAAVAMTVVVLAIVTPIIRGY
jgi:hypothetical protein